MTFPIAIAVTVTLLPFILASLLSGFASYEKHGANWRETVWAMLGSFLIGITLFAWIRATWEWAL